MTHFFKIWYNLGMKKSILFTVILLIAIGAAAYMWYPTLTVAPDVEQAPAGKLMSVEDYVSQNISALSPEKEPVGGKFFVTEIYAADGRGTVSYEDGHVAYTADFTYESDDRTGHKITSFLIRD
jgi:hypothetical protein